MICPIVMAFEPPNRHLDSAGDLLISAHPGSDGLPCPTYVRKLGAYGLAGVATFAVAVALMLTASSTPTAEAELATRGTDGTYTNTGSGTGTAENGDTVYIRNAATGFVLFEITAIGSASASFTHGDASDDGQTLYCNPATTTATCDVDTVDTGVTVAVKIDNDSGKGAVFVKHTPVGGDAATDQITVSVAQVPTTLEAKLVSTSINSGQGTADAGRTLLNIRLTDADGAGIAGERLTLVSTRALLSAPNTTDDGATALTRTVDGEDATLLTFSSGDVGALAGTVNTSADGGTDTDVDTRGYARVAVEGGGSPGVSTITITVGEVTRTVDVTLHGTVKTISAEAEQSSIEVGGDTFIVVTALDSGGNPVKDQNVSVKTRGGVVGPEKLSVKVLAVNTAIKDAPPAIAGTTPGKGDLPACGTATPRTDDTDTTGVDESTFWVGSGTNDDGQCVIKVSAPDETGTANDAARGTHTITLVANATGGTSPKGVNEAVVEIQVGGPAASIESDAPERIDPSDEITVNVTVVDDENVRVGKVTIEVIQTAGDGKIITEAAASTSDGRAKFTYLAPSTPGVVEFLVRTKDGSKVTAKLPIIIAIAEEAPPEPPTPPAPEIAVSGQSGNIGIQNAASLEALLDALECGDQRGTSVTINGYIYAVGAPSVANAAFVDNVDFPIDFGGAYVRCGG